MTKPQYRSSTGLYTIRLGADVIHEGITIDEVADRLKHYKDRWEDDTISWAFNPSVLKVEEFSGTFVLKPKR